MTECTRCGCSELAPCVDAAGRVCAWVSFSPALCSACVDEEVALPEVDGGFARDERSGLWLPV